MWNIDENKTVALNKSEKIFTSIAFSLNGKLFAAGNKDGTVRVQFWQHKDLIDEACSRLTHNLLVEEWREYVGNDIQTKMCSKFK